MIPRYFVYDDLNDIFQKILKTPAITLSDNKYKWVKLMPLLSVKTCGLTLSWSPGYPWYITTITIDNCVEKNIKKEFLDRLNFNNIAYNYSENAGSFNVKTENKWTDPNLYRANANSFEMVDGDIKNAAFLWQGIQSLKKETKVNRS